ncbi:1-acyl-sn-glycerol-3-phosphate acyltransferase beta isoform X3 [Phyllopteryx taeniolatus]|uniref:1-acyl-sn-glycerol-3-phosphate acyltransferase beta isoform X3 n=1 Tax=Phyllopteryx taeniolatus TaxID=161469 RepID=UPI002AD55B69|nr:1-acyl-sn-glycerol-3-phosphate acyltransferase beta isoform X3 [Phyllopteryx taeniolatus]
MDVLLWMAPLMVPLVVVVLLWSSGHTLVFYFKKCFYVAWMMALALLAIPLCVLKSGGRDVENMRIIRSLVRHVKYFLGLRFEVSGWEHLQTPGPYVVISNHQSSLDVLGLMEILPDRCTMIAKKELIYAGTVGLICWLGGIVFINRKKTSDAKSVMADAAKTMLNEQAPIIPVVFSSYSNFYLRKEKQFKSGKRFRTSICACTRAQSASTFATCTVGTIRLKILPKIETKGMTSEDVASLADKSFDVMRSAFLDISGLACGNGPVRH